MILEALAAGLVGLALLWLVTQPVLFPSAQPADETFDLPDPEDTPRGQALLALREIDFDRATGKLSDADYAELHARYSARAIALLDDAPVADDPIEAMIAARVTAIGGAPVGEGGLRCLTHRPRGEGEARFCSVCGAGLVDAQGCCAGCGVAVPPDALFCPGCGKAVLKR